MIPDNANKTINILCVEDDDSLRDLYLMYFQNFLPPNLIVPNVDIVENYDTAIEKLNEKNYNLLIADGLNGECFRLYDVTKKIPNIGFVILSSNISVEAEATRRKIPFYEKSSGLNNLDKIVTKYIPIKNNMPNDSNSNITQ